jgi:hypothetical protein
MAGVLILLIVGTAAGVGAPALGIWLWVRHGRRDRSITSIRSHHHPGGAGGALFNVLPYGPDGNADSAKEGANLVLDGRQTEQGERSIPDEISDLERLANAAAYSAAEAAVPAPPFETVMEADRDPDGEHGQATAASAAVVSTEVVTSGLDFAGDETRAAPREAATPVFWPADVKDTELSADPGPTSAQATAPPAAAPPEIAPCEAEYEAGTACPYEEAQPQKFARLDEILEAEACGEPARESDDTIETAETADGAECGAAESAPRAGECAVPVALPGDNLELVPEPEPEPEPEPAIVGALPDSIAEVTAGEAANTAEPARARARPAKPALHRDRRGQRRALTPQAAPASERAAAAEANLRTPAEAKLRLMLHPIRRTATLSAVLARPAGFPDRITLLLGEGAEVGAYSEDRYDDVDIEWTADLLSGEVRLDCEEGYQWLRSGRRIRRGGRRAGDYVGRVCGPALAKHDRLSVRRRRRGPSSGASVRVAGTGVPRSLEWDSGWLVGALGLQAGPRSGIRTRDRSDGPGSWCRIGDTVLGRPAHPRGIFCGGRSAEDRNRAVTSGGDRYDRWTSGRAGQRWRLDRRWMGQAGRSSHRCRARPLGGLPDHRGSLD